jgi:hypothetical protein
MLLIVRLDFNNKEIMYNSSSYDFVVVKSLYAAALRESELGHLKWGDMLKQQFNQVILTTNLKL